MNDTHFKYHVARVKRRQICRELSNSEIGLIGQPLRLLSLERFEKSSMDLLEHI